MDAQNFSVAEIVNELLLTIQQTENFIGTIFFVAQDCQILDTKLPQGIFPCKGRKDTLPQFPELRHGQRFTILVTQAAAEQQHAFFHGGQRNFLRITGFLTSSSTNRSPSMNFMGRTVK